MLRRRKENSKKLRAHNVSEVRCKNHSGENMKIPRSFKNIPKRIWILLYLLHKLGRIPTAIKLQKFVFLLQTEGRVGDYRFFKHHYGPYSRELDMDTMFLSRSLKLMQTEIVEGTNYPYYLYSITPRGRKFVDTVVKKVVGDEILERASVIIKKYGTMNHWELQEYVYKTYVISEETFKELYPHLKDDLVSLDIVWKERYTDDCPASFFILAIVDYATKVLTKVKQKDDAVLRGVCIASVSELTAKLIDLTSTCQTTEKCPFSLKGLISEVSDYINFIDHYCSQHNVLENILDVDFSDFLNEEELQRLEKVFKTTKPSELIY